MEQLEIHSKSYLVRWIEVKAGCTISWSVQPHKKSIRFGIFKHPGGGIAPTPKLPLSTFEGPPTPGLHPTDSGLDLSQQRNASSAAVEKLKSIGLKPISWHGTCEANRVTTGRWDVPHGEGGMYGLVFDNTFSKQLSKVVTFVPLIYPTDCFPPTSNQIRERPATNVGNPQEHRRFRLKLPARESSDSISQIGDAVSENAEGVNESTQPSERKASEAKTTNCFTGVLQKRRRKRHQGFARRFFVLEFSTATLSYYHDRHTSALRGAVPLSLAAIGANVKTRDISIDSGAEVWHLRASNAQDFEAWKNALELARTSYNPSYNPSSTGNDIRLQPNGNISAPGKVNSEEEREWSKVESLEIYGLERI
ncbi:MAG: hypothetical protein Q9222_004807 [Ikaeria aurantiellina]